MTNKGIKSLFHYTTANGLKGILSTQTLWATSFEALNDLKELKQAEEILFSIFRPIVADAIEPIRETHPDIESKAITLFGSYEKSIDRETYKLIEVIVSYLNLVFILSFCVHDKDEYTFQNGILSMWRAYGMRNAYAIEFNADEFTTILERELETYEYTMPVLDEVVYDFGLEHLKKKFETYIEVLRSFAMKIVLEMRDGAELPNKTVTTQEFSALVDVLTRVKNRGFAEEKEFRFATVMLARTDADSQEKQLKMPKHIYHHPADGFKTVPRIHMFEDCKERLPINRIIVGPHENKDKYATDLQKWLKREGYDIPVTISDIPFRGMEKP